MSALIAGSRESFSVMTSALFLKMQPTLSAITMTLVDECRVIPIEVEYEDD